MTISDSVVQARFSGFTYASTAELSSSEHTALDAVSVPFLKGFPTSRRSSVFALMLERFSIDVNRNNKGVPTGSQIRFGLL